MLKPQPESQAADSEPHEPTPHLHTLIIQDPF